jgi:predicted ABC-type ATPase
MSHPGPQMIIIAGPNGAGKSTAAPYLLADEFGLKDYINADTIAHGLSAFHPESVAFEAGRIMLRRMRELSAQQRAFAFESTLASRSYAPRIRKLQRQGYDFHLLFLWLRSADLAVERVRQRVRMRGHDVPEETVRRRYVKGVRNFFTLYKALAKSWAVYDNTEFDTLLVATGGSDSELSVARPELWRQFGEASERR